MKHIFKGLWPKPAFGAVVLSLGVVWGFLFLCRLGQRELTSSHEARAAQNALSIVNDGQWALPRLLDQKVELQKPPLYYWLVALAAYLQGGEVDGWAVRLPAALSALGCVFVVIGTLWLRGRPLAGLLAGSILATFIHFTWLARTGRIDMPLTFCVTVALCALYLARDGRRAWMLGAYLAVAAGIMLKGPIAVVLPTLVAGILGFAPAGELCSRRETKKRSTLFWGVPLVAVFCSPWYIWANIHTQGRFFEVFFWYHNIERGLGSDTLASHPWWFYFPRLAVDLLPWSLLLPVAFFFVRRRGEDAEARFGIVWLTVIFSFLSLMRFKRADYLLPAYPGAAILLGCFLERALTTDWRIPVRFLRGGFAAVLLASVGAWISYIHWFEADGNAGAVRRRLAQEIRSRTTLPVIFFRAEDHALALHVGRPLDTILEWENLEWWASQPAPIVIVTSPECAAHWPDHLKNGRLEEICRSSDLGCDDKSRPWVVLRSIPEAVASVPRYLAD